MKNRIKRDPQGDIKPNRNPKALPKSLHSTKNSTISLKSQAKCPTTEQKIRMPKNPFFS